MEDFLIAGVFVTVKDYNDDDDIAADSDAAGLYCCCGECRCDPFRPRWVYKRRVVVEK